MILKYDPENMKTLYVAEAERMVGTIVVLAPVAVTIILAP
jgi:hypothetical protein